MEDPGSLLLRYRLMGLFLALMVVIARKEKLPAALRVVATSIRRRSSRSSSKAWVRSFRRLAARRGMIF